MHSPIQPKVYKIHPHRPNLSQLQNHSQGQFPNESSLIELFCGLAQILRTTHPIHFARNGLSEARPVFMPRISVTRSSRTFQTLKPQGTA
jgi:hypothetical protein